MSGSSPRGDFALAARKPPRAVEPYGAARVVLGHDDELGRPLEVVEDAAALGICEGHDELEATLRERHARKIEDELALPRRAVPTQLAQIACSCADERPARVTKLERDPRRRQILLPGDPKPHRHRLTGEVLPP